MEGFGVVGIFWEFRVGWFFWGGDLVFGGFLVLVLILEFGFCVCVCLGGVIVNVFR